MTGGSQTIPKLHDLQFRRELRRRYKMKFERMNKRFGDHAD